MDITRVRDVGRAIKARRLALGWSQSDLAERVQTTRRWISEIEHGKNTAEIGLVVATLRALDIRVHLETPGERPEAKDSTGAGQSAAPDLEEVTARHVDGPRRKIPRVGFRRTNR